MKLEQQKNKLTIQLEEGEKFSEVETKDRDYISPSVHIWIKIEKV